MIWRKPTRSSFFFASDGVTGAEAETGLEVGIGGRTGVCGGGA